MFVKVFFNIVIDLGIYVLKMLKNANIQINCVCYKLLRHRLHMTVYSGNCYTVDFLNKYRVRPFLKEQTLSNVLYVLFKHYSLVTCSTS